MKNLFLASILFACISCNQQPAKTADSLSASQDTLLNKPTILHANSVINKSFIASNGEKFLRFEMVINASPEETWKLFSTEEGMKKWAAPVVKLDFKIGGLAQTNYDSTARIGDKGTIPLGIINYLPNELITYKVTLNEVFSEKCRNEDDNLQEIVQIESIGNNQTKLTSTMFGWGTGSDWDKTYLFFERGNKWTYEQLAKLFAAEK